MNPRYTLKVSAQFAAAHQLRDYPGACSRLHGHNWRLDVEVTASRLDELGMVVDFRRIRQEAREVVERLDHRFLNEIPPFDEINPTAENIAAYLYRELDARLRTDGRRLESVTLWETENACVRYREETP